MPSPAVFAGWDEDILVDVERCGQPHLFWLDYTDAQIAASGWPAWQKTIATALAHYGGYIGDTDGGNTMHAFWSFEGGTTYSVYGATSPVVGVANAAGIAIIGANSSYPFNPSAIDWANHLHVLDPCVPKGLTGQAGGCTGSSPTKIGQVSPASLSFAATAITNPASCAPSQTTTLSNVGTGNLTVGAPGFTITPTQLNFQFAGGTCVNGQVLTPGQSCTVIATS